MKKVLTIMFLAAVFSTFVLFGTVSAVTTTVVKDFIDYGVQSVTSTSAVIAVGYQTEHVTVGPTMPFVDYVFILKYWEDGSNEIHSFPYEFVMSLPERLEKTITGLKPGTKYYYQFYDEAVNSFTTLKSSESNYAVDFDLKNYSADATELVNANSQFAFDLFKQINATETSNNVFISPFSITAALAMLYQGADGDTRDEIAKALRINKIGISRLNSDYKSLLNNLKTIDPFVTLSIGNSIWYKEGFDVKSEFLDTNNAVFGAEVKDLDFTKTDAADTINNWISNATNGMIEQMVNPPLLGEIYLINAIYFKGAWTKPFDPKKTGKATFKTESGKNNTVDMMHADMDIEFSKGSDYSAIRLPYGEQKISMHCILPAEGLSIDNFLSGFSVAKFNEIKKSLSKKYNFSVSLPKFKITYGVKSLKTALNALGMNKAFDAVHADLSGITAEPVFVDDVLHKAVIDVNENGTEAAATTIVAVTSASLKQDFFRADRPFVLLIVDDTTGSILFMGKAADLVKY